MLEPNLPGKLVFSSGWQSASIVVLSVLVVAFVIGAVGQLAA